MSRAAGLLILYGRGRQRALFRDRDEVDYHHREKL